MKVEKLDTSLDLPISLEQAWAFFSVPDNLNRITPSSMSFAIESKSKSGPAYPGMLIAYTVKPLLQIPLYWVTEITQVKEKAFFIDEQRIGPYAMWHHEHHFEAIEGGVRMRDILHYKVPFGPLGTFINWLFIRKKVRDIFKFRSSELSQIFPENG